MSYLLEKEIECPRCAFPNSAELWSVINVASDPELKDLLLGGEINRVKCASCREIFYADEFFLYHDKNNEIMAFVFPITEQEKRPEIEERAREDFIQSQIVLHLAQLHNFPIRRMRPFLARRIGFPRVMPVSRDRNLPLRESILGGIHSSKHITIS